VTALSVIQAVAGRIGLNVPTVAFTSTDRNVVQLRDLLQEGAEALSKAGSPSGFQALQNEWTFVTVAAGPQTNTPIPDDLRRFVPDSFYNRTTNRKVTGPLTPQQYQQSQVWPQLTAPYLTWRERDNTFVIVPDPPAGETIAYEYISAYWAKSSANVAKAAFTADDDGTYLDEELLKLDLRWRWKQAKGLDYGEDMVTFERARDLALGDDGGSGQLNQGGGLSDFPDWYWNVPQMNFPAS
jgi:hypothetical protein